MQEKADELNQQAWQIRVSDSNLAFTLSKEAVEISTAIDYIKGKAEGLRTQGFCFIRLSRHAEALPLLEEAQALFTRLSDAFGLSDVSEYFGIIARSQGDYAASLTHLYKALDLRQKEKYQDGEALSLYHLGVTYRYLGNLDKALEYFLHSLTLARKISHWIAESYSLNNIGSIYYELEDGENALEYYNQSLSIRRSTGDKWGEAGCLDNIGNIHFKLQQYDEAVDFYQQALAITIDVGDRKGQGNSLLHLANIYLKKNDTKVALMNANESLQIREETGDKKGQAEVYLCLAEITTASNTIENAAEIQIGFLQKALLIGEETKALDLLCNIHNSLYATYKNLHQYKDALKHLEAFYGLEKQVHSNTLKQKVIALETTHRIEQNRKETERLRQRNIELAGFYEAIKQRNEEIEAQKKIAEDSLRELKETQAQLIQREKMASLGELTAGIAHEIQNPLNFVNNFSEVNTELIEELKNELQIGSTQEAIAIANDIKYNEEKINHHGKRADAIVKGMLQHSRSSTGQKEPTNINALCNEYLRLCYHGLRAKDKSFNATMKTDFDETIGKINIIPQDIGRVVLNLLTNAFYAVDEKKKSGVENYEPTVSVTTNRLGDKIAIRIIDNGNGIPQKVLDKIFQPFFTTKPTGQGTGLGLSLSYDIIKAHGGEINVEAKEGDGAVFIILLSLRKNDN